MKNEETKKESENIENNIDNKSKLFNEIYEILESSNGSQFTWDYFYPEEAATKIVEFINYNYTKKKS